MDINTTTTTDDYNQGKTEDDSLVIQKEHENKIKVLRKNAIIYGGIGSVLFLLIVAVYVIPQFITLQSVRTNISSLSNETEELSKNKKSEIKTLQKVQDRKLVVEEKFGNIIPRAFPEIHSRSEYQREINFLVTFFEDFALANHDESIEILTIPSITFGKPRFEKDMFIIPIHMNIEAGEENFFRFLQQIDKMSGSIDKKDFYKSSYTKKNEPIPVMSIDALSLVYPKEKTAFATLFSSSSEKRKKTYSFTVSISAYFQATKEMKEMFGGGKK